MEVYERNQVLVISDEIWCDLIAPGQTHVPTQMVGEWAKMNTAALYSLGKTFNLSTLSSVKDI